MATMLTTNSLQPPKTGTSRWSKALPDVPGSDAPSFYDDYYDNASPRLPPAKEPPPPPPRSTSISNAKALPPSLPPLHLLSANSPPSAPPKMAIPRRPIGKISANPPPPPLKSPQQPFPSQAPPSPSDSLSSILSAYSRSSGESLVRSPYEANSSALQSEANTSPSHQVPLTNTKTGTLESAPTQQQQQYDAPKLPAKDPRPPPLPSKDTKYHLPATPAPVRKPVPEKKLPELNSSSPQSQSQQQQQPQLWRRRSSKAERNLEFADLKLLSSHGSTAATQSTAAPLQQAQQEARSDGLKISTTPNWQPGSTSSVDPAGQDVQQTPAPEQMPDTPMMGGSSSKFNRLKDKLHLHRRGKSSNDTTKSPPAQRPGTYRPPTPEYQKEDIKTPIVDSIVSPLSPASSPEPAAQVSPELPDDIPQISPPQHNQEPLKYTGSITRKAIPTPKLPSPVEDKSSSASPSLKNLSPPVGSLPPSLTNSRGSGGSSGSDTAAPQVQSLAEVPSRFPPRDSSTRSNVPPRQLAAEHDPRLVSSDSQGPLYRGRDGTLYPEMKVMQEYDPQVAYFPKQSESPLAEGTIFKAPPLKKSHFSCYHGHKTMNRRTNRKLNNSGNDLRRMVDSLQVAA
ncbi:unnamed protein product [Fusarium equiseti]|uniref:Uncharacterized protein n=1 Tax=Fusarium equiseti TaxID=61235 RepID=A0A8J2IEQ1_FUSEQ|nr:unnamed protein product [Fusarium equiseti]